MSVFYYSKRGIRRLYPDHGPGLFFELDEEVIHHPVDYLVGESTLPVLQNEAERIRLLSGRQLVALVHVEQRHAAEQLPFGRESDGPKPGEGNLPVQQQGEVAPDLRESGKLRHGDRMFADAADEEVEIHSRK